MTDEQKLSHREISRRGGIASTGKRSKEEYKLNSKKAAQTMKERYGEDYFKNIRRKALEKRKASQQSPIKRFFASIVGTKEEES
jgi:U3 small nucleolar ribonucleoprotein component